MAAGHLGTTEDAPSSALREIATARGAGFAAGTAGSKDLSAAASREPDAAGNPDAELDADQELEAYLRVQLSFPCLSNRAHH